MRKYYLIGFLIVSILAGCLGEPPEQETTTEPEKITKTLPTEEIVSVKKIKESARHQVIGYLEEVVISVPHSDVSHYIYYVKDKYFKLVGFVSEKGGTYRYDEVGKDVYIGDFILERGIRQLLKFTGAIYFEDFEAPLIIED